MHHAKLKLAVAVLLWSLLAGCASQTYEELEEEYTITGDRSKLERRESQLERAEEFFLLESQCKASDRHIWMCTRIYSGTRIKRRSPQVTMDIDSTIREWRLQIINGCDCVSQSNPRR